MTVEEIKELINIVNESGIAELEVQRGDSRVRIKRSFSAQAPQEIVLTSGPQTMVSASPMPMSLSPNPVPVMQQQVSAPPKAVSEPEADTANLVFVKSPIVGTFYEAASPETPPFVKIGDRVTPGQVLCIIESMKLMNEIEAEVAGVIVSKLIENAKPVEYGQPLFGVNPS